MPKRMAHSPPSSMRVSVRWETPRIRAASPVVIRSSSATARSGSASRNSLTRL